jgi:hypothetical protein
MNLCEVPSIYQRKIVIISLTSKGLNGPSKLVETLAVISSRFQSSLGKLGGASHIKSNPCNFKIEC